MYDEKQHFEKYNDEKKDFEEFMKTSKLEKLKDKKKDFKEFTKKLKLDKNKDEEKKDEEKYDEDEYDGDDEYWDINLWDVCFSSSYGFPNNKMGFEHQWYLPKLHIYVEFLKNISTIETIKISYKKVCENKTLEDMKKLYWKYEDHDCKKKINPWYCHTCHLKEQENNIKCDPDKIMKYLSCDYYNDFCLNGHQYKLNNANDIIDLKWEFAKCEGNIFKTLVSLENYFKNGGLFFNLFFPETIETFEEAMMLDDDGNEIVIIAKSKNYFYYMIQTN